MIRQRLMTALVLAAGLLLALFVVPASVASILFGLLLILGAWEWAGLASLESTGERLAYVIVVLAVALVLARFAADNIQLLAMVDMAALFLGLFWMLRFPVPIPRAYLLVLGLVLLPIGWMLLSNLLVGYGPVVALLFFALVAAADIGAFFAGRAFGRFKLAPAVSPGKTWEGVAGGAIATAVVAGAAALALGLPAVIMSGLGLLVAIVSVIGDLTISMFKRSEGIKDTGTVFPGHGGVLDRIDSLLAALPVFYIGVVLISGR